MKGEEGAKELEWVEMDRNEDPKKKDVTMYLHLPICMYIIFAYIPSPHLFLSPLIYYSTHTSHTILFDDFCFHLLFHFHISSSPPLLLLSKFSSHLGTTMTKNGASSKRTGEKGWRNRQIGRCFFMVDFCEPSHWAAGSK